MVLYATQRSGRSPVDTVSSQAFVHCLFILQLSPHRLGLRDKLSAVIIVTMLSAVIIVTMLSAVIIVAMLKSTTFIQGNLSKGST